MVTAILVFEERGTERSRLAQRPGSSELAHAQQARGGGEPHVPGSPDIELMPEQDPSLTANTTIR
jgi:hypothetical protein